jgi:lipopolysaccharide transport system ATP-binding protein
MMRHRNGVQHTGDALIHLDHVSKVFAVRHEAQDSFQSSFIRLFRRENRRAKPFWAIRDVSFEVKRGDCFGVIGPNGSGKSTLLKLITRILEPTEGDIAVRGRIASLLELGAGFHPDLTGRENIYLNGSVYGMTRKQMQQRMHAIIDYAELGDFMDVPIRHYSSGMHVRLGFAVAIHTDPDILLVDEVLAVGDLAFQRKCLDSIQQFRSQGGTLLFVSHDSGTIEALCNRAIWLDHGRIRAEGAPLDVVMSYMNRVSEEAEEKAGSRAMAELEEGRRWGNGRVQVTQVEMVDKSGRSRSAFAGGESLDIRLSYEVMEEIDEPVFGIGIHHQNGVHVCGPNTQFDGLRIPGHRGRGQVVYHIQELPLLEGAYVMSVAAVDAGDGEVYDYHDRAYPLRVLSGRHRERYGIIALGGSWSAVTNEPDDDGPYTDPARLADPEIMSEAR